MEDRKAIDRRNVAAILLIIAGGLLFLETFDVVNFSLRHYIFSWKTLLIAIGVIVLVSSEQRITGYILIGLGILFWLPSIANYNVALHQVFWPLVLIGVGLIIITRRSKHDGFGRQGRPAVGEDGTLQTDYIDDVSIFGGGVKRYSTQNLKGGNITAIFGGSEIDLTTAQLASDGTVVDLFTMFGGTKFIVPGSWQVKSEATSLFGGFTDKRHIKPDEAVVTDKVLLIKGVVIFGGVEIKSY
jgi:predicted membrane protein